MALDTAEQVLHSSGNHGHGPSVFYFLAKTFCSGSMPAHEQGGWDISRVSAAMVLGGKGVQPQPPVSGCEDRSQCMTLQGLGSRLAGILEAGGGQEERDRQPFLQEQPKAQ